MLRLFACLLLLWPLSAAADEWRGHGGPVRALDVSRDGKEILSGGFDGASILWNAANGAAKNVLNFHAGSVDTVAFLPNGDFITGGEDGIVSLWQPGSKSPVMHWKLHEARVAALAVAPDGKKFVSAGWDGVVKILASPGTITELKGHQGPVNAVRFLPDGRIISGGQDGALRFWKDGQASEVIQFPSGITALTVLPDGRIAAGFGDGVVRLIAGDQTVKELATGSLPVIALAHSPDGKTLAAAQIRGAVSLIDVASQKIRGTLVGPGLPVWSLVIMPDNATLITGGGDRMIRRWNMSTGEPVGALPIAKTTDEMAAYADDPGAKIYRACIACHTLKRAEGPRAGPSLEGIFGRKIGTEKGYAYSDALKGKDLIWTPETVSKLFEVGPAHYLPGTKMPEQTIGNAQDRAALIQFLEKATKN
ncbi:MAG: c-type cytochrome [Beijerinckiaceae bacterium]|nr:c-type cytochrome [Beijerinckiaceae bacterium]